MCKQSEQKKKNCIIFKYFDKYGLGDTPNYTSYYFLYVRFLDVQFVRPVQRQYIVNQ
jgi:hypothetical protein